MGDVHDILQGEKGEQGGPLMPALFSFGQHDAFEAICRVLLPSEKLFAFLDDIFIVGAPERMFFFFACTGRGSRRGHTIPVRNCSSTCGAAPRCHSLRKRVVQSKLPRLETPGDVPPLWTVEPTHDKLLPAVTCGPPSPC